MKKQIRLSIHLLYLGLLTVIPGSTEEIILDFSLGDHSLIEEQHGAELKKKEMASTVELSENEIITGKDTDILINFNQQPLQEKSGKYKISETNIRLLNKNAWRGEGSAIFQGESSGIVLSPHDNNALFQEENIWKDFSIEFWLYPATVKDGEVVFLWRGVRWKNQEDFFSQEIRCSFENRKLQWTFSNLFLPYDQSEFQITVTPVSALIPREWNHHLLRFDSATGRIEYLINGIPEAISYANYDNRETGEVFLPYTGRASEDQIILGRNFTGFMDDFQISTQHINQPDLPRYSSQPGEIRFKTLDLGHSLSHFEGISVNQELPSQTEILYYYRIDDYLDSTGSPDSQEWILIEPGKTISEKNLGRFIQIKSQLFTNGNQHLSPRLNRLTIKYEPAFPPPAPTGVQAVNENGNIRIQWNPVPGEEIGGYKVYFGKRPGHYFGEDSLQGFSPLDVSSATEIVLEGLDLHQLYFFAVVAYDKAHNPHSSGFSREVSARPIRIQQ